MASINAETSLADTLTAEHRRLDELWVEARTRLERGAVAEGAVRLAEFVKELGGHIRDEEETLFPAFEERTGMKSGPTTVMRMEHRQMEALLEGLAQTLAGDGGAVAVVDEAKEFAGLLDRHDKKEEGMLYPMMARAFGEDEGSALLRRTSVGRRDG